MRSITANPTYTCANHTTVAVDASSSMDENERRAIYNALSALAQKNNEGDIDVVVFDSKVIFDGSLADYLKASPELSAASFNKKGFNTNWASIAEEIKKSSTNHLIVITDNIPNSTSGSKDAISYTFEVFNSMKENGTRITMIGSDDITPANAALTMGLVTSLNNPIYTTELITDQSIITYDYIVLPSFNQLNTLFTENDLGACNADKSSLFTVHPNPARDFFTVENTVQNWTVHVFDAKGRQRLTHSSSQGTQVSLESLEGGHYEVQCTDNDLNQILGVQKIIVVR